jgi:hypothetical protein
MPLRRAFHAFRDPFSVPLDLITCFLSGACLRYELKSLLKD